MLACGSISWNLRAQKTVVLSSTKAEYMALSDTGQQIAWMINLFRELGIRLDHIPINIDNQGTNFIANNPVQKNSPAGRSNGG